MTTKVAWATEFKRVPNRLMVLQAIRDGGPLSRADLARRLQLSRPTMSRIIDALVREGVIARAGKSGPTGGRLGDLYTFGAEAGVVVGLELGTRVARAAVATLEGEIVHRIAHPLSLATPDLVLAQLHALVIQARGARPHARGPLRALGVAVPGVVRRSDGTVHGANMFQGLNDRPLQSELQSVFGVPVAMDNDVNYAAIGECQAGCARGRSHVAYLFVGRGIGAGLVLDGQVYRGSSEAAGEIGDMVVDCANLYEHVTSRGCLEARAGIDSLVALARERGLPYSSPEELCEQAFGGDPQAQALIQEMNDYLAVALINLVAVIDPEIIVLGGDLAELPHADALFARTLERLMGGQGRDVPPVLLSQLQGEAALYGAVQAAVDTALTRAGQSAGAGRWEPDTP